jgi:glycosyltransferase involved in cell wall biosynthesis
MTRPTADDPCLELAERPPLPEGRPIRVAEILATGTNGGAQEHLYSLLVRLDRTRYEPLVISLSDGSTARRIRDAGFATFVFDEPDDAIAVGTVAAYLASRPPDIVHNHMYRAELVGTRAALALEELGLARPYTVGTVHSSRIRSVDDRDVLRRLTPHMDRLIAVSRSIVGKLGREGRTGAPVSLIYNGVDLERYDHQEAHCTLPEDYGFPPDVPVTGVVARLEPEKGHATLVEAWPMVLDRVPEARLLIVGEGSLRASLEARCRALGLLGDEAAPRVGTRGAPEAARVIFTGRRDDVPAVTAALDVSVLPSYREALGLSILEAMALSRPVVASAVGGIPEMIEHGRTGLLVPPHDETALADAIVRLLSNHPLADMLARAAHDLVHDRFCIERMVREIQSVYDEGAAEMARRRAASMAGDQGPVGAGSMAGAAATPAGTQVRSA